MNVVLRRNQEQQGLELQFPERPERSVIEQIKEQGFRWHHKKKLWFAKETPARLEFAKRLGADIDPGRRLDTSSNARKDIAVPDSPSKPNTFAAHYNSIGDAKILSDSQTGLRSHTDAFFSDLTCHYSRNYNGDCIRITDLGNAGRVGKTCTTWSVYPSSYGGNVADILLNDEHIASVKDLYAALSDGKSWDHVRIDCRDEKAVDVFSPFKEYQPLKSLPDKWTKRNFMQALLSGQIFRGEVAYRYTDDYAMDAAYHFGEGTPLHMPSFARRAQEDWGSLTSVYNQSNSACRDGSYVLSYSEHSNSGKTLWFDLHCDIGEGKRRATERQAGLDRYNQMLKSSCITVPAQQIDPGKIYVVQQLEQDGNSGRYGSKQENIPGYILRSRIEDGLLWDVLSVQPLDIRPDEIYEVSNFFHRPDQDLVQDERVIDCGNWKCIVTGLALQELIAEKKYMPHITQARDEYGPEFHKAESTLQQFAEGRSSFFVGNATDYQLSLSRLRSEYARAGTPHVSLDDMIHSAAARTGAHSSEPQKNKEIPLQH